MKVKSIKPADKKIVLAPDTTWQAEVTVLPENAANKELKWKSSNEKVATVDENGLITGHKKGNCKITATATDGSKKKAAITVQVKNFEVVITKPGVVPVNFDTTDANTESVLQIGSRVIRSAYVRTVKYVNGVVESAGDRMLRAVKAGEGSVDIVAKDNKKTVEKSKHSVYVAPSAFEKVEGQEATEDSTVNVRVVDCAGAWPDYPPENATDGNVNTYWESIF